MPGGRRSHILGNTLGGERVQSRRLTFALEPSGRQVIATTRGQEGLMLVDDA